MEQGRDIVEMLRAPKAPLDEVLHHWRSIGQTKPLFTPCVATLHTVFRHVDRETLEANLGAWAERVVASPPPEPSAGAAAVAQDGTTLRGAQKQGAPGVHLLSALSHHVGLTLAQQAVDALLMQRHVAQTIVDGSGDYVMIVKDNQPKRRDDIELVLTLPPADDPQTRVHTVDIGHGRIEQRNITTSEALGGYSDWPGLAQVFALGRHVLTQTTQAERGEVVYGGDESGA